MVSVAPTHMAVFTLGTDTGLYRRYKDEGNPDTNWTGWAAEGGKWILDPVSTTRAPYEANIFMIDMNHDLLQANFNFMDGHGIGAWKNLGVKVYSPPAVAKRTSKGIIHIFHIGLDHALYHKSWDGTNYTPAEGHEKLGGVFINSPAAASTGAEEVSVFAVGLTDGRLHHYHWKSSSGWGRVSKLPSYWVGTPSVVSDQEGAWDVFGINPEGKVNHVSFRNGKQSDLEIISGPFQTVDAVSWGPGRIDLIGWGMENGVYHKAWNQQSWGEWENLGGVMVLRPTPICNSPGALCVTTVGTNYAMYIKVRDPNTGNWGDWVHLGGFLLSRVG